MSKTGLAVVTGVDSFQGMHPNSTVNCNLIMIVPLDFYEQNVFIVREI